jgi:ABC-2 type transport system ATP-binding protein
MLQVTNLIKKYGERKILNVDNLTIGKGITHLKGINGSGKTTFSKIIAGIIPFQGEILLNGRFDPRKTNVKYRKLVNYAEPEAAYPEFLTAHDLLSFVGKAKEASQSDISSISMQLGIDQYLYDHIGSYSSGMIKRLSLSLAFLGSPSLIVLDEPFNTLDTSAIEIVKNLIDTHHNQGVNFILVSHQDMLGLGVSVDASFVVKNHTISPE